MPRLDDLSRADVPFRTGQFWAYAPHDFHRIAYVEWGIRTARTWSSASTA
ncbi:hypothetical protein [Methylobacterium tardum]